MAQTPTPKVILSKDSLVPLGLVAAILGGALWINTQFITMQNSLTMMASKLSTVEAQLDTIADHQWTEGRMKLWIELMKASNKGKDITIPDIPK